MVKERGVISWGKWFCNNISGNLGDLKPLSGIEG